MEKRTKIMISVSFFILLSFVVYSIWFNHINDGGGYNEFQNFEFGTKLTIEVAPHGIYTNKFVTPEKYLKVSRTVFLETAELLNKTVYYSGYGGRKFWIDLTRDDVTQNNIHNTSFVTGKTLASWNYIQHPCGYYYEVPYRWW